MKIVKLKSDKLCDTQAAVAQKAFVRAAGKLHNLHGQADMPTGYLLLLNQKFKDESSVLLVLGDLTTTWVKYAKEIKKTGPKNVLWGECFGEKGADGKLTIRLLNKAGSAKLAALLKLPEVKSMLKKAKADLDWAAGLSDDSEETPGLEDRLVTLDDKDEARMEEFMDTTTDGETQNIELWENLAEDAAHIKRLMTDLQGLTGEAKTRVSQELQLLILEFLNETENTQQPLPPKLQKFGEDLLQMQKKRQKQQAAKLVQELRRQLKQAYKMAQ